MLGLLRMKPNMSSKGKQRSKRHTKTKVKENSNKNKQCKLSSSSDEDTNYADQIEQFKEVDDNEEADIDKLIVRPTEPAYSTPTFSVNDNYVRGRQSKTLPMNRILKNNLDIVEQPDEYTNVNRQVKQTQALTNDESKAMTNDDESKAMTNEEAQEITNEEAQEMTNDESKAMTDEEDNIMYTPMVNDHCLSNAKPTIRHHKQILNNDVATVYLDYSGPYKINRKVFRVCYLTVVVIMLLTLLFIIGLQHFRKYLINNQSEHMPLTYTGGTLEERTNTLRSLETNDSQPMPELLRVSNAKASEKPIPLQASEANALDIIANKHDVVFEPPKRLRDSKGRFIKVNK